MLDLGSVDMVLMRQDPPFDMAYITATHILQHIHPRTFVLNDPVEVRNAPEKLFVTHFPDLMPPTLITSDREAIRAFREEHEDIILKPLFGNGGAGVFHVDPRRRQPERAAGDVHPVLPRADRRPALPAGDPRRRQADHPDRRPGGGRGQAGAEGGRGARQPARRRAAGEGDADARATARSARRSARSCSKRGLLFVGIDVIGDYLTEINVTSPTGIQEIGRFDDVSLEAELWDAFEQRWQASRG